MSRGRAGTVGKVVVPRSASNGTAGAVPRWWASNPLPVRQRSTAVLQTSIRKAGPAVDLLGFGSGDCSSRGFILHHLHPHRRGHSCASAGSR